MTIPRLLIDAPTTFTPSPYGLLSVAQPATPQTDHWRNGVTWQASCIGSSTTYDECYAVTGTGAPPAPEAKAIDDSLTLLGATSFTVFTEFDCSPLGYSEAELRGFAEDALRDTAGWQVERAFWSGQAGAQAVVWPHLAAATAQLDATGISLQSAVVTGAGGDAATTLGYLESELADCLTGQGVIHVPRIALPTLDAWGLVKQVRGQLQTLGGNIVVAGDGYPGTSPTGAAPGAGTAWLYGTGPVFEMHSAPRAIANFTESFDRGNNTVQYIAEQTFLLGWSCCHVGAPLTLGVPTT